MVRNTSFNSEEYNCKMNHLKRNLTLDLQLDNADSKRKINSLMLGNAVLSSPDVKKCNLSTPDIEKFLANHVLQTPTPNTTSDLLYSNEFDALNDYQNDSSRSIHVELPKSSSSSNSSINNYINLDNNQYPAALYNSMGMSPDSVVIKDEPQTVPSLNSTPPVSPINMESQEKIKLERKRMRNRVAASKCRKRKLERIAKLEEKVKCLKNENTELGNSAIKLRNEIYELKEKVMKHFNHGCKILIPPGL